MDESTKSPTNRQPRHPELVSGSILPFAKVQRGQAEAHGQIMPIRILALNKIDFPLSVPLFQLFLALYRLLHAAEYFISNKNMHRIAFGKAVDFVVSMLPQTSDKATCNANIKRSVGLARENVDAGLAFDGYRAQIAEKWILKQVQDDGWVVKALS